ncbi:MAG TPA: helix-turn-helix transcriptional regulator [Solirubrobacteraceae bacterium]|jgi:DNA-binding PadR family transcriptional regulator
MRSPINWALLGLLIKRPSYGYELVQRFERTYEGSLELSSRSQIYAALDRLARRGMIEHVEHDEAQRGLDPLRQPKLRYRVTDAGVHSYEHWLIDEMNGDPGRSRLITQQFAALAPAHALRVLERCEQMCLETIGRSTERGDDRDEALAERLAGEEERLRAGAMLEWIEYARSELRAAENRSRP